MERLDAKESQTTKIRFEWMGTNGLWEFHNDRNFSELVELKLERGDQEFERGLLEDKDR